MGDDGASAIFAHGSHLHKLHLSRNKLTVVPPSVRRLTCLEELYIQCNKLVTVAYVVYAATSIRAAEWVAWDEASTPQEVRHPPRTGAPASLTQT